MSNDRNGLTGLVVAIHLEAYRAAGVGSIDDDLVLLSRYVSAGIESLPAHRADPFGDEFWRQTPSLMRDPHGTIATNAAFHHPEPATQKAEPQHGGLVNELVRGVAKFGVLEKVQSIH